MFLIKNVHVYYKRYLSLLKTIFLYFEGKVKCSRQDTKQNGAIILRLLPHILFLYGTCTHHAVFNYVSIFLPLTILFALLISSKIQQKKSFVKWLVRNLNLRLIFA